MVNFSVLMSVYYKETASNLKDCLESILSQTIIPTEIILVEDGALTEELYEIINEYSSKIDNLRIVKLDNNSGLGVALNEGLRHCHFDIIARMDSDDVNYPSRFEEEITYMEAHPYVDVVSAWVEEFDNDEPRKKSVRKVPEYNNDIYSFGKKRNPINHPVVMFRKKAVMAVNGYIHMPDFEDYYLWVRLLLIGKRFYNIQHPLLHFRRSRDLFRRRGGDKYVRNEIIFQKKIHELGYISRVRMCINIIERCWIRIIPLMSRSWIYTHILR